MRFIIALLMALGLVAGSMAVPAMALAAGSGYTLAAEQQQPSGQLDVNIDMNEGGGGAWYASPVWIAIGFLALVVLLLLIVAATRGGGGTTVIKD